MLIKKRQSYKTGYHFRINLDGYVYYIKTGENVGYLSEIDSAKIFNLDLEKIEIDIFIKEHIEIPVSGSTRIELLFEQLNLKTVRFKKFRKIGKISTNTILKYYNELPKLQAIILYQTYIKKKTAKQLSHMIGISTSRIYELKRKSLMLISEMIELAR